MDNIFRQLIDENIEPRTDEFKLNLKKADINKLTEEQLLEILLLPAHEKETVWFILEYKLFLLKKNGINSEIAYLNYLMSYLLFMLLTPVFAKELALEYAEEAIKYEDNSKYKHWLESLEDENNIC